MNRFDGWLISGLIAVWTGTGRAASTQPADDFRGTTITVHTHGGNLTDVVADLARQAGVPIEVQPYPPGSAVYRPGVVERRSWPAVTLDLDRVPFWQVLANLCDQAGATVERTYTPKVGLTLSQGVLRRDIHGAFMVTAGGIYRHAGGFLMEVTCLWDPGADVVVRDTWLAPAITAADGRSVIAHPWPPPPDLTSGQDYVREVGWGSGLGFRTMVPLFTKPHEGEAGDDSFRQSFGSHVILTTMPSGVSSVRVSGTVRLWVATKWETITMPATQPDPHGFSKDRRLSDGHWINVWFESTGDRDNNTDGLVVRVDLRRANPDNSILYPAEWLPYRHLIAAGKVTVADADGRPYWGPGENDGKDSWQADQVASGRRSMTATVRA